MYFSRTFKALNFHFQIQGLSRTFKVRANPVDHQEILARVSSEIGQDEQNFENERKLFDKSAMIQICHGLTQAVTNGSFPSNDCNCFFV